MKKNKQYFLVILLFSISISAYSQWSCPSKLDYYTHPIKKSNFSWGSELIASGGYITNNYISTASVYLAGDYTKDKHNIYIEGGFKFWDKYDIDAQSNFSNQRLGIREAFYNYNGEKNIFKIGLQSTKIDNSSLLNERMIGAAYRYKTQKFKIDFRVGTVREGFSRNGLFCNTAYIYDLTPNLQPTFEGFKLFQTNLAMLNLSLYPGSKKKIKLDVGQDEITYKKKIRIQSYGITGLAEFGPSFNKFQYGTVLFGGGFVNLKFFDFISFKNELLYQNAKDNNTAVYIGKLSSLKMWDNNTKTSFYGAFYALLNDDNNIQFLSTFNNIFAGEVLRIGSGTLPLLNAAVKHHFTTAKTSIKLEFTQSLHYKPLWELDLKIGYSKIKRLNANLILSYINSNMIPNYSNGYLARIELRYYL